MIYRRKESIEALRINEQRPTGYKRFLPMSSQATCVSDCRRIGILNYPKPDDRIFPQQVGR